MGTNSWKIPWEQGGSSPQAPNPEGSAEGAGGQGAEHTAPVRLGLTAMSIKNIPNNQLFVFAFLKILHHGHRL